MRYINRKQQQQRQRLFNLDKVKFDNDATFDIKPKPTFKEGDTDNSYSMRLRNICMIPINSLVKYCVYYDEEDKQRIEIEFNHPHFPKILELKLPAFKINNGTKVKSLIPSVNEELLDNNTISIFDAWSMVPTKGMIVGDDISVSDTKVINMGYKNTLEVYLDTSGTCVKVDSFSFGFLRIKDTKENEGYRLNDMLKKIQQVLILAKNSDTKIITKFRPTSCTIELTNKNLYYLSTKVNSSIIKDMIPGKYVISKSGICIIPDTNTESISTFGRVDFRDYGNHYEHTKSRRYMFDDNLKHPLMFPDVNITRLLHIPTMEDNIVNILCEIKRDDKYYIAEFDIPIELCYNEDSFIQLYRDVDEDVVNMLTFELLLKNIVYTHIHYGNIGQLLRDSIVGKVYDGTEYTLLRDRVTSVTASKRETIYFIITDEDSVLYNVTLPTIKSYIYGVHQFKIHPSICNKINKFKEMITSLPDDEYLIEKYIDENETHTDSNIKILNEMYVIRTLMHQSYYVMYRDSGKFDTIDEFVDSFFNTNTQMRVKMIN